MTSRKFWVLAAALGAVCAVFAAANTLAWGGSGVEDTVQTVGEIAGGIFVTSSTLAAARRSGGRYAIGWYCWSAYGLLFAAGATVLLVDSLTNAQPQLPSLSDVLFFAAVPAGTVGALSLSRSRSARAGGLVVSLLDAVLFATGLLLAGWVLVLGPVFDASTDSALAKMVSVAYPSTDALVLTLLAIALLRAPRSVRPAIALLALGMTAIMLADGSLAYQSATGNLNDANSPLGAGWVVGLAMIAIAALRPRSSAHRVRDPRPASNGLGVVVPLVPVGFGLAVTMANYLTGSVFSSVAVWAILVLVVATVARQAAAMSLNNGMRRRLAHQATHDGLTGLTNRTALRALLDDGVAAADGSPWQLLMIDLDRFKSINDTFGHTVGDELLVAVAQLVSSAVRSVDVVARLGGDEFAVAVRGSRVRGQDVARRILSLLEAPITLSNVTTTVGASIGVVTHTGDWTAEELLRDGDLAMYAAKARGGGQCVEYTPAMHAVAAERAQVESDLRQALMADELRVQYQPIVDMQTGRVVSLEALVRWMHPQRGMVGPDAFIPIAEETGLIVSIGERVLVAACEALVALQTRHRDLADLSVSVNISAVQLDSSDLVVTVADALRASGLDAHRLVLEVTETAVLRDIDSSIRVLEQLRALGVRIALDDFGVGSSSIGNLRRLPVDIVKIDKSLVDNVPDGRIATKLLDAVHAMAAALELRTVVEGVERTDQADHLRRGDYEYGQGYLFSRPVDIEDIDVLITSRVHLGNNGEPQRAALTSSRPTPALRVLVLDDDPPMQPAVQRGLAPAGMRAVGAGTLREAEAAASF